MNKAAIFILLVVFAAFLLPGCTQEDSQYVSENISNVTQPEGGSTYTSAIIKQWRILSIVFVLLSIGLISLCYPVANAFNLPELKAWADVELSEAFSTVLIVIVVMVVLIFVELTTHAILLGSDFDCGTSVYCPVYVAEQYIQGYLDTSLVVFTDLMESAVMAGKLATMSVVFGTNYLWLLYASFSMKVAPEFMIDVTTLTQEMQFLMGMRDALVYQQFILKHVSETLAPAALLIGIIFRSFFATRKLGGLLMAFGIGFLLVFPASYALASYTLQTTLYGSSTTGGDVSNQYCTASCRELAPLAYKEGTETTYTHSGIMELFPQGATEDDNAYGDRITLFIAGENCTTETVVTYVDAEGEECDPDDEDVECYEQKDNIETCISLDKDEHSDVADATIVSCGVVSYRDCPIMCRSMPYPNTNPDCASRFTEYQCRNILPHQCFITRYADMNDPMLGGLYDEDSGANDACPSECRPMVGLKKYGCASEVIGGGEKIPQGAYGEEIVDELEDEDYQDPQVGGTYVTTEGCPNNCRWVTTAGKTGAGCQQFCNGIPTAEEASALWTAAATAGSLAAQIEVADDSCYTIIPSSVFTNPDCIPCSYLIDPGFASYPPVHQRCDNLCGKAKMVGVSKDDSRSAAVEGFNGPGEMQQITKLVVPAVVLPLLNLVITFMFIRTLSPILGGDVDLPGMSGLIK